MSEPNATRTTSGTFVVGQETMPVLVVFGYARNDPYAVTVTMTRHDGQQEPVTWTVSRDVLRQAVHYSGALVGPPYGTVQARAVGSAFSLILRDIDDDGVVTNEGVLICQLSELAAILLASVQMVPVGHESVAAAAELDHLLEALS